MRDREADFTVETRKVRFAMVAAIAKRMRMQCPSEKDVAQWSLPAVSCGDHFVGAVENRILALDSARAPLPRASRQPMDRTSWVYFIRGGELIKVGTSKDVEARLASLRTGSPLPLELVYVMRGSRDLEQCLHGRFESLRSHGEWFHAREPLISFISEMKRREMKRAA